MRDNHSEVINKNGSYITGPATSGSTGSTNGTNVNTLNANASSATLMTALPAHHAFNKITTNINNDNSAAMYHPNALLASSLYPQQANVHAHVHPFSHGFHPNMSPNMPLTAVTAAVVSSVNTSPLSGLIGDSWIRQLTQDLLLAAYKEEVGANISKTNKVHNNNNNNNQLSSSSGPTVEGRKGKARMDIDSSGKSGGNGKNSRTDNNGAEGIDNSRKSKRRRLDLDGVVDELYPQHSSSNSSNNNSHANNINVNTNSNNHNHNDKNHNNNTSRETKVIITVDSGDTSPTANTDSSNTDMSEEEILKQAMASRPVTPFTAELLCDEEDDDTLLGSPDAQSRSQLYVNQERAVLKVYSNFLKTLIATAQRRETNMISP